ncbi:NADH dehydrogenase (ubiquinone) B18 subunit [Rhynchophorus ferrugineus]|uniref:NADH dehydrogenase [ubiquinone] 1 beta subcomplex subunit 7 n=1 Tax=Rhynchophorus ferrugineus TaxID=354439 RepID=A0A834M9F0_RHYFE|nr:hypothetical protein GWI33_014087 [Rhynchophorus ferrugineus]
MGNHLNGFKLYFHPEVTPGPKEEPTFDPLLGFPEGRKPREMKVTEAEMRSAKLPLRDRDFCAHLLIAFKDCRQREMPFVVKCSHEKHEYLNCKYEDYVIRAKEYERERRLRVKREELKMRQC